MKKYICIIIAVLLIVGLFVMFWVGSYLRITLTTCVDT